MHTLKSSIIATAVLAVLSPAHAQDAVDLDRIVVQSSKTGETLQETPASVTVLDLRTLQEARVTSVRDLGALAPNVQVASLGQIGGTFFNIRGIESNPFIVNRAVVYVDDVPYRELDDIGLVGVDSVEILRGPQGTLYGANSEAGAIVITSRAPGDRFEADVSITGTASEGRGGGAALDAFLSTPLVEDRLGATLALSARDVDAYTRNRAAADGREGEVRDYNARLRLVARPDDATDLALTLFGQRTRAPGLYEQEFLPDDRARYDALYGAVNGGRGSRPFDIFNDVTKNVEQDERGFALRGARRFDPATLTVIASDRTRKEYEFGLDLDLTALPFGGGGAQKRIDEQSYEVRLGSPAGARVTWVAGVNALHIDRRQQLLTQFPGQPAPAPQSDQRLEGRDRAVFAQATVPLRDGLRLTGGLRYDRAVRTRSQNASTFTIPGIGEFATPGGTLKADFDEVLPKLALSWDVTPAVTLYTAATKGWLPGGLNLEAVSQAVSGDFASYDAETLWNYEAGFKGRFLDGRLRLAGALFRIEGDNWQEFTFGQDANGVATTTAIVTSDAKVVTQGLELEAIAELTDSLRLTAGLGVVDAEYKRYVFSPTQDFSGNTIKLVAPYDLNVALRYQRPDGWFASTSVDWRGKTELNQENSRQQDALALVGVQAGWEGRQWSARAFVDNLTDRRYFIGQVYNNFAFGNDGVFYGPYGAPRTFGAEVRLRY